MAFTRAQARTLCANNAEVGLTIDDPRLDVRIDEAMRRLIRHYNSFVRREEYESNPITFVANSDPLQLDCPDSLKMVVLATWREENNAVAAAADLENRAYGLLDQDTVQAFEVNSKNTFKAWAAGTANCRNWYTGKVGLDTAGGLALSATKLKRYVSRAATWLYQKQYEYMLIERNRVRTSVPTLSVQPSNDTDVFNPVLDYEAVRLVIQAFALEGVSTSNEQLGAQNQGAQLAGQYYQEAIGLIYRKMDADLEALRHGTYTTALGTMTSNTFGFTRAQLALELPDGLKYSDIEMGRLVNSAERRLVESGKWKNAIADFEVTIADNGETDMPPEVETVLGATICDRPTLIRGRWYQVVQGGPGRVKWDNRGKVRELLIDRGEFIVSGHPVRRYFVNGCPANASLTVTAKRRFATKSADGDVMQIGHYSAVKAAAQCLKHEGFLSKEDRDPGLASYYWGLAQSILAAELAEYTGDSATPDMPVQTEGFGAGEMDCPL